MKAGFPSKWLCQVFLLLSVGQIAQGQKNPQPSEDLKELQNRLVSQSIDIMNNAEVSYVYGGSRLGQAGECQGCNRCLQDNRPKPSERLARCPSCQDCGLDCSHFLQLVFSRSGLEFPYLTTNAMMTNSSESLFRKFQLVDLQQKISLVQIGDLLVYKGHVVMLTNRLEGGRGDIIHATGGRDIREPGQGIQRETNVILSQYRGPLLRILRHKKLFFAPGSLAAKRLRSNDDR